MIVYDIRYMDMIVMISELWMLIGMAPSISYGCYDIRYMDMIVMTSSIWM